MSFSNPRRTSPVTRSSDAAEGLTLKTNNAALRKGATFHSPTSPSKVPSLPRRSQTSLDDVVDAHCRRAAMTIGQVEDTLATITLESSAPRRDFRDNSLPVPRGVLDHAVGRTNQETMDSEPEGRVLRPRGRRSSQEHESDSGLGSSIASTNHKRKDGTPTPAAAITRSAAASKTSGIPRLSSRAVSRIHEHTLKPLLAKTSLKDFQPIVIDCPRRIQESQIVCLRDLEKTLLFMAPERAKSAELYLDFCLTSIRCIQATVEYLTDREQTRPHDRPYSGGYFIDLVEQIRQHAQQMQEAREKEASGESLDEMDVHPTDEVKLVGGLATNGRPAELVRVKKNGKTISVATGKVVEEGDAESGPIRFKRSMSQQAEEEEEIMRSMARRKKNASPDEYAPKKCKEVGCNKVFKRPCDLTKHEKTHSRPWKCPLTTCKYHDYGWPTEKEMDRHVNDKHSSAPPMYECHFKPCPYKSKRESNCKQHMEKAHGWTYVRTKTNGRKNDGKLESAGPTPRMNNLPTPSSEHSNPIMTPPAETTYRGYNNRIEFPAYPSTEEFNATIYGREAYGPEPEIQLGYSPGHYTPEVLSPADNGTPSSDGGHYNPYPDLSPEFTGQLDDIYGAHVQLPTPPNVYNKGVGVYNYVPEACPPVSAPHLSPVGQPNAMLYTPISMAEVDEGFDEYPTPAGQLGDDFLLFPDARVPKTSENLFSAVTPSIAAGYSQPSSQDFNLAYNSQPVNWAPGARGYPSQN